MSSLKKLLDLLTSAEQANADHTAMQPQPPDHADPREVKRSMGFDPDDPNVHVRFLGSFKNLDEFTAAVTNGDVKLDDQLQLEDLIPEDLSHEGLRKRDMNDRAGPILDEVIDELTRAVHEHHAYNSPHEGWAVIKEELDELWDEIKLDEGRGDGARKEALQVAVTAIRYVLDLRPGE